MAISNICSPKMIGVKLDPRRFVKYLTMYNRMCPEARFVLNRIASVKGRRSWLTASINGSKIVRLRGVPYGSKCNKVFLKDSNNCLVKIEIQIVRLKVRVRQ